MSYKDINKACDEILTDFWNEPTSQNNQIYDENTDVLFSPKLSEPLYQFVMTECLSDYQNKRAAAPLSIAEYVYQHKLKEFADYCIAHNLISSHK